MRLVLVLALTLKLLVATGQALQNQPTFEHLTIPGNIRSTEYVDIAQDREGLIWIAANG